MPSTRPENKKFARQLRKRMTPSEKKLWAALRDRRFVHLKFRRQQGIGPYIADFCCWEKKIVLEFDGESHLEKEAYDSQRQLWLQTAGWTVIRFWDTEVFGNIEGVMQRIFSACNALPLTPRRSTCVDPLPGGEGIASAKAQG